MNQEAPKIQEKSTEKDQNKLKKKKKLEELKMSETCSQGIYLRNKPQNVLFTLPPDSLVNYLHIPTSQEVIFSFSQSLTHCR